MPKDNDKDEIEISGEFVDAGNGVFIVVRTEWDIMAEYGTREDD
jgi:hypothetical protein